MTAPRPAIGDGVHLKIAALLLIGVLFTSRQVDAQCVCALTDHNRTLDCTSKSLTSPPACVQNYTNITDLVFHMNQLQSLPAGMFTNLSRLQDLLLSSNQLELLPVGVFDPLVNLKELYISGNKLRNISAGAFKNLTNLRTLDLHGNRLQSLPFGVFDNLTKLEYLYLQNNQLQFLLSGVFHSLTSLQHLWLFNNSFQSLPDGIFTKLVNLVTLNLHNNQLQSLPSGVFSSLAKLQHLWVHGNPWLCTPSLCQWLPSNLQLPPLHLKYGTCQWSCCTNTSASHCSTTPKCTQSLVGTALSSIQCGSITEEPQLINATVPGGAQLMCHASGDLVHNPSMYWNNQTKDAVAGNSTSLQIGSPASEKYTCTLEYSPTNTTTERWAVSRSALLDIDECSLSPHPCLNDGTCYSRKGDYLCVCPAPFTGKHCSTTVDPDREKDASSGDQSGSGAIWLMVGLFMAGLGTGGALALAYMWLRKQRSGGAARTAKKLSVTGQPSKCTSLAGTVNETYTLPSVAETLNDSQDTDGVPNYEAV